MYKVSIKLKPISEFHFAKLYDYIFDTYPVESMHIDCSDESNESKHFYIFYCENAEKPQKYLKDITTYEPYKCEVDKITVKELTEAEWQTVIEEQGFELE